AGIAAAKGLDPKTVAPFYVEQEAPAPPGGLPQPGRLVVALPDDHLQYALTWYGLAAVLAAVFGAWLFTSERTASGQMPLFLQGQSPRFLRVPGLACGSVYFAISVSAFRRREATASWGLADKLTCRISSLGVLWPDGFRRRKRLVQYISTRGEAPPLGFADAILTGLAQDGGLYVPDTWPRLDAGAIAGFAGRSYAEVAVEIISPFVDASISAVDLARIAREAYGDFRHPAVAPLTQIAVNTFLLELFHGPTLAFKDLAMQFLARLMDNVLAARGERRTIVVATSGDTGGAAVEAFRDRRQVDLVVLFPHGRISDVQRRMMTTS